MRLTHLAATLCLFLVAPAFAQAGGARDLINRQLQGVGGYNQSIDDAMNEKQPPAAQPAPAPAPGELKSGWLTRRASNGKSIRLYFSYPATLSKAKPTAGILVLQEWWGLNDDIQQRTRDLATKGFYAVAPDLFDGKTTDDPAEAQKLKAATTDASALSAMKAGLDLIQSEESNGVIDAKRVAALGWCYGGQQALLLSIADPRIKATAIFYGPLVTDPAKLKTLQGPVLGIFGNDDKNPSPDDVKKFQAALKTAGKTDVTIYPFDGVGHAFASKSAAKTGAYNEEKAADAFAKLNAWLDAKLPR
jgi:carboxymethylenebutenolidase